VFPLTESIDSSSVISKPQQAAGVEMKVVVPIGKDGSVNGGAGVHVDKGSKPQPQWNIGYTQRF